MMIVALNYLVQARRGQSKVSQQPALNTHGEACVSAAPVHRPCRQPSSEVSYAISILTH